MKDGRLSRPRHSRPQPVPKALYRSSCRDKHNRPRRDSNLGPLTSQSGAWCRRSWMVDCVISYGYFQRQNCWTTIKSIEGRWQWCRAISLPISCLWIITFVITMLLSLTVTLTMTFTYRVGQKVRPQTNFFTIRFLCKFAVNRLLKIPALLALTSD